MQEAAQEDRLANEAKQAATKKLMLLPAVMKHMLKLESFLFEDVYFLIYLFILELSSGIHEQKLFFMII